MTKEKKILAWHFVRSSRRLGYDASDLTAEPGFVYSDLRPLVMCRRGMHASVRALDALEFAPGPIACRVRLWGEVKHGREKMVAHHREILAMGNASQTLHRFWIWCLRETPLGDDRKAWDLLSEPLREAVEVKERWLSHKASWKELAKATETAAAIAKAKSEVYFKGLESESVVKALSNPLPGDIPWTTSYITRGIRTAIRYTWEVEELHGMVAMQKAEKAQAAELELRLKRLLGEEE